MKKEALDLALVPIGLIILASYHVWLVRCDPAKMGVLAVQSLRNNIMASTLMASTAIMLSSVIAVLMTNSGGWPSRLQEGRAKLVVGDASELGLTIKFFSILSCFLLAFLFEVQSVRYYSHSTILINVPVVGSGAKATGGGQELRLRRKITPEFVAKMLDKGNYFWSLGLRAFYFSFPFSLDLRPRADVRLLCRAGFPSLPPRRVLRWRGRDEFYHPRSGGPGGNSGRKFLIAKRAWTTCLVQQKLNAQNKM
ncbi:unnamed protein product [Spirodela intermedia]|uniref:Uncharacterized protein n=1 Tax=Spirodela intermedia TaxID=51605 RepID=A0A7I8IH92_SPIIN|nr:unnamed protein product [Spirodela intermedia]CAA6657084.1 unnamed protein product [Spirodela intermedia]